jgi:hypothetical protein
VLQWLRANGCPWNGTTCEGAALLGHREVVQWALDNGCEWDHKVWDRVMTEGGEREWRRVPAPI